MADRPNIIKRCPDCGWDLVLRTNSENGSEFLGCRQWPLCKHTESVPESYRMRLAGAELLPGMEG